MHPNAFSAENIAQNVVKQTVALYTANAVKQQITDHTEWDPNGIPVQMTAGTIGQIAAGTVGAFTDPLVAKAIGAIKLKLANRKAKKNAEKK